MSEPKAKKARQSLSLQIQPKLPDFPFLDTFFEVNLYLFDETSQVKGGDDFDFPLQVRLMFDDKPRIFVDKDILEVDPPLPQMNKAGKVSFRVRIRDVSMSFDNREFCLHVQAMARPGKFVINPVISDPMTVVRYRLMIRKDSQPPPVWFKDEGGRDKCIEIVVDLMDADNRRVRGQEVPLKVSLLYEDMHVVTKQDILKLSSDTKQYIDETGVATLRLRIEDVSKNHQSKGFVIRVAPDTQHSPLNFDISPDTSTSISVRSKRNRRNKGGRPEEDTGVVGSRHTMGGSIDLSMPVENPLQDAPLGGPVVESMDLSANPMHKALTSVVNWTRAVVNGLYQIQWQLIGYETKPDGSPDISRPLFNITNPNAIVTSILQTYRNDTMDNLRFMVQTLENPNKEHEPAGMQQHSLPPQQTAYYGGGQPQMAGQLKDGQAYGGGPNGNTGGGRGGESGESAPHISQVYSYPSSASQNTQSTTGGSFGGNESVDLPPRPPMLSAPGFDGQNPGANSTAGGQMSTVAIGAMSAMGNIPVPGGVPSNFSFSRPGLARGKSNINSSYISASGLDFDMMEPSGFPMLPLVRENTFDLLAGMDPQWFVDADGSGGGGSAHLQVESQVHYMVAKVYFSNAFGELGFPAFDQKHSLLGFYKEGRNEQGQTVAYYIPLPPAFTESEKKEVSLMLQKELREGSGAVAQIVNNDLNQLKERVLTYHWSRSQQQNTMRQASAMQTGSSMGR